MQPLRAFAPAPNAFHSQSNPIKRSEGSAPINNDVLAQALNCESKIAGNYKVNLTRHKFMIVSASAAHTRGTAPRIAEQMDNILEEIWRRHIFIPTLFTCVHTARSSINSPVRHFFSLLSNRFVIIVVVGILLYGIHISYSRVPLPSRSSPNRLRYKRTV